jgi:NTE family protein
VIVGTSFGAVVGALYATGRPISVIGAEASALRRRDVLPKVADFGVHRGALFSGDRLEAFFDRLLDGRTFADLDRELAVVATDIETGERVVLREGSVARALRASSSLPGIFAPVEIDGRSLIDGGIGSPIPVATLEAFDVDVRIGIGAGLEYHLNDSVHAMRSALGTGIGRGVHRFLGSREASGPFGRLGLGLSLTADSWLSVHASEDEADGRAGADSLAGGNASVKVHTRPPIGWLGFHRAAHAIDAGAAALDRAMPAIRAAGGAV